MALRTLTHLIPHWSGDVQLLCKVWPWALNTTMYSDDPGPEVAAPVATRLGIQGGSRTCYLQVSDIKGSIDFETVSRVPRSKLMTIS